MNSRLHPTFSFRGGFTLIEVIIVIGITAVLAGMILSYTSTSRDQVALSVEAAKLAQTISKAKGLSVVTYARPGEPMPPCGYGVHVDYDAQQYVLFGYDAPNCYEITSIDPDSPFMQRITVETLPPNVNIKTARPEEDIRDIFFIPPDPKTWIWRAGDPTATSTSGRIYLRTPAGTSLPIQVSQAGQITF